MQNKFKGINVFIYLFIFKQSVCMFFYVWLTNRINNVQNNVRSLHRVVQKKLKTLSGIATASSSCGKKNPAC